jgi:hypothetical protein
LAIRFRNINTNPIPFSRRSGVRGVCFAAKTKMPSSPVPYRSRLDGSGVVPAVVKVPSVRWSNPIWGGEGCPEFHGTDDPVVEVQLEAIGRAGQQRSARNYHRTYVRG